MFFLNTYFTTQTLEICQSIEIKYRIGLKILYYAFTSRFLESIQKIFFRIVIYRLQWPSSEQLYYLSRCMLLGPQT